MKPKNTICLWFDKDAEEAARFYAATFPDSKVTAVHKAPGDFPGGKEGDVLTVEFTVLGIPCLGLNGGPTFKHSEAFSFQVATDDQEETDRYWNAIVGNGGQESAVRLVQGPLGPLLADHPARADRRAGGGRRRGQARLRRDDDDEEDRRRHDRRRAAGLTWNDGLRQPSGSGMYRLRGPAYIVRRVNFWRVQARPTGPATPPAPAYPLSARARVLLHDRGLADTTAAGRCGARRSRNGARLRDCVRQPSQSFAASRCSG